MAQPIRKSRVKEVPLSEVKDDLSRLLREADPAQQQLDGFGALERDHAASPPDPEPFTVTVTPVNALTASSYQNEWSIARATSNSSQPASIFLTRSSPPTSSTSCSSSSPR